MIHLLLLALWPIFNYVSANLGKVNEFSDVAIITGASLGAAVIVGFFIKSVLKKDVNLFLPAALAAIALFFNYGPIVDVLGGIHLPIKASYIWLIVSIFIFYG